MRPASGNSGPKERYLESVVCSVCETCILTSFHPHTAISVTLQIEVQFEGIYTLGHDVTRQAYWIGPLGESCIFDSCHWDLGTCTPLALQGQGC